MSELQTETEEPTAATFQPGDVVMLASGGTKMTVTDGIGKLTECRWFDEFSDLHTDGFPHRMLVLVPAEPKIAVDEKVHIKSDNPTITFTAEKDGKIRFASNSLRESPQVILADHVMIVTMVEGKVQVTTRPK